MRMKVNTMDVRMRLGDAIDPCQLANGVEAVIGYECQGTEQSPFLSHRRYRQYMQGVTKQVSGWGGVSLSGTLLRVTGRGEGWGGWWCCGFVFDDGTTLMIQPQAPKCSRPFQLNLLF